MACEGGIQLVELEQDDALFEAIQKLIAQGIIEAGDVVSLQAAGIRNFNGLRTHISENPIGVNGLSNINLNHIIEAAEIILEKKAEKKWKTTHVIEVKALMTCYHRLRKRIEVLTASIALNTKGGGTCSDGQLAHWETELRSCKKRVANIEANNF